MNSSITSNDNREVEWRIISIVITYTYDNVTARQAPCRAQDELHATSQYTGAIQHQNNLPRPLGRDIMEYIGSDYILGGWADIGHRVKISSLHKSRVLVQRNTKKC
jgi:hypothetical protein